MTTVQVPTFIISRTIRCNDTECDTSFVTDHVDTNGIIVTKSTIGRTFFQCPNVADAEQVFKQLTENGDKPSYITYSLFFKNPTQMDQDTFNDDMSSIVTNISTDVNVTYQRLDNNGFTGKLVVDVLDDYMKFKNFNEDDSVKFYHFDSNRNRNFRKGRSGSGDNVRSDNRSRDTRDNRDRTDNRDRGHNNDRTNRNNNRSNDARNVKRTPRTNSAVNDI